MAKEIYCAFGIDVDAVAGWIGSYGGVDSPDDISRGMADLGAVFSGSFDPDRSSKSLRTLSNAAVRDKALDIMARVLQQPAFPEAALAREKARVIAGLKETETKPESIADKAFLLPALYHDRELSPREAQTLLLQDLQKIQQLTTRYQLITVCTHLDAMPLSPSRGLGKRLYDSVSGIVRIKQLEQCTFLELVKQQKNATIIRGTKGQLRLEEFGLVS